MNKAFKLLIASCLSISALAQNSDSTKWNRFPNLFDNPFKTQYDSIKIIDQNTSVFINTNRISNAFIYPFLKGGPLNKSVIDDNLSNDKNKRFNLEANFDLRFINLGSKRAWYIATGYHQRVNLNVSSDAMKLIFRGNTQGNIFEFNDCNYTQISFNKLGVGRYFNNEKTAKPFNLRLGIYGIQGLNYQNITTKNNNYLNGNVDSFNIRLNYTAAFAKQGFGLGGEISFNQTLSPNQIWGFQLNNFGYLGINQSAETYGADGSFKFNGIVISDLGNIRNPDYFKHTLDSLTNPVTNKKVNQSKSIWIAPVSFLYYTLHHGPIYYQFGVHHSGTKTLPVAELRSYIFLKSKVLVGLTVGGIGQPYLNTDIRWAINRHLFLHGGFYHLEALTLPDKFGGLGGNFALQAVF